MRVSRSTFAARIVLALALLIPAPAWAQLPAVSFDTFYLFGDSLTDTGNDFILTGALGGNPATPPSVSPHRTYYRGRFSNGPLVFEYLCKQIKACETNEVKPFLGLARLPRTGAVSFGFGGSGSDWLTQAPGGSTLLPGLKTQVELFRIALAGRRAPADALYAIFTGPNDYPTIPGQPGLTPTKVVANIEYAVRALYGMGARHIMVVGLPDPQIFPPFTLNILTAAQKQSQIALTTAHNLKLAAMLAAVEDSLRHLDIIAIDANAAVLSILPNFEIAPPTTFFFPSPDPNVPVFACLFSGNLNLCPDVPTFDGGGFLFWDLAHPTTEANQQFAVYLYRQLQEHYDH